MREECYAALFALLEHMKCDDGIKMASRRLRTLPEVSAAEMPALFMSVDRQTVAAKVGVPPKRRLSAMVYLYVANPNPAVTAASKLNDLLDLLERTVTPNDNLQTLGDLVEHTWIEGTIAVWEGPKGERAAAGVPIIMLLP